MPALVRLVQLDFYATGVQDGCHGRPTLFTFIKEVSEKKDMYPMSNTTSKLIATVEVRLQIITQPI